ncbi:MAG: hypothetical protein RL088_2732 [Verrucomicrobiota bacterium]|jgi:uncharacterized protein YegJ (DUF2314 family)
MRLLRIAALLLLISFGAGCRSKEKEAILARRAELIDLMHGNSGDADIEAAIQKSRATLGVFMEALKAPRPGQSQFLVRREFPTETAGKRQILIVNDVTYDGKLIHGRLDDRTALPGSGAPRNGLVSFPPEEICDWMFNEDGKAAGGYMLRVLKQKMTPKEWQSYAEKITFKEE